MKPRIHVESAEGQPKSMAAPAGASILYGLETRLRSQDTLGAQSRKASNAALAPHGHYFHNIPLQVEMPRNTASTNHIDISPKKRFS